MNFLLALKAFGSPGVCLPEVELKQKPIVCNMLRSAIMHKGKKPPTYLQEILVIVDNKCSLNNPDLCSLKKNVDSHFSQCW